MWKLMTDTTNVQVVFSNEFRRKIVVENWRWKYDDLVRYFYDDLTVVLYFYRLNVVHIHIRIFVVEKQRYIYDEFTIVS